ncbi:MAG TPA: GNAT family N-acetyltransferase [Xanthobacteraceae bacterium]|nr:GNAT family N-acetyltransferase [Xanthobacteraceae bacterium]
MTATNAVRDNAAFNRFELEVDGHLAVAHYRRSPGLITFTHTEVPSALGGRGVGSTLARGALELARAEGVKVASQCPFVSAYLAKHAEFNDLLE